MRLDQFIHHILELVGSTNRHLREVPGPPGGDLGLLLQQFLVGNAAGYYLGSQFGRVRLTPLTQFLLSHGYDFSHCSLLLPDRQPPAAV